MLTIRCQDITCTIISSVAPDACPCWTRGWSGVLTISPTSIHSLASGRNSCVIHNKQLLRQVGSVVPSIMIYNICSIL
jgi:hypothetical protein